MKYCLNCGKVNSSRICPACGSKQNLKQPNYCGWCGNELNPNAAICPNCKMKTKQGFLSKLLMVLGIVFIFSGILCLLGSAIKPAIGYIVAGILLFPFVDTLISSKTTNSMARIALTITRVAAAFLIISLLSVSPEDPQSIPNRAYAEAVEVFQHNLNLEDENIENSNILVFPDYGTETQRLYQVTIQYSTQNNVDNIATYTIDILYDEITDTLQVLNAY